MTRFPVKKKGFSPDSKSAQEAHWGCYALVVCRGQNCKLSQVGISQRNPRKRPFPSCSCLEKLTIQGSMEGNFTVIFEPLNPVRLFATPWTAAHEDSLSFTISRSLLKFITTVLVMPTNCLILCCPLLLLPSIFPSIRSFPMSWLFTSGGQSVGASASALPMNIQGWFPLGLTGLISLLSKLCFTIYF